MESLFIKLKKFSFLLFASGTVVTGCEFFDRNAWDEKTELVKDGYVGLRGETAASMNSRLKMLLNKYEEKISRSITPKPRPTTAPAARPMSLLSVFDEFPGLSGNRFGVWVVTLKKTRSEYEGRNTIHII